MDIREKIREHKRAIAATLAVAVAVTGYTTCAEDDTIVGQIGEIITPLLEEPAE